MGSRFGGFALVGHLLCSSGAYGWCAFTQGIDLLAEGVRTEVASLRTAPKRNRYTRLRLHRSTQGIGVVCAAAHCRRIWALLSCRVLEISSPREWRAQGNRRITGRRRGSTPLHERPGHSAPTAREAIIEGCISAHRLPCNGGCAERADAAKRPSSNPSRTQMNQPNLVNRTY